MSKTLSLFGGLMVVGLCVIGATITWGQVVDKQQSLDEAVEDFNTKAVDDPVGKDQEPLTVDEVLAAIRLWDRPRWIIDDKTFHIYERIAKTRVMPDNTRLKFLNACHGCNGYDCVVWWIDLEVSEGNRGYSYRIRDRKISCSEPKKDADRAR